MTDIDLNLYSDEEKELILLEAHRRFSAGWDFESLEELLVSDDGFGLGPTVTPLQRAICRILQGVPLDGLEYHPDVQKALDYYGDWELKKPPSEIMIIAAIRTAKSLIAAAHAVWSSQTIDVSHLLPGEIPRYPIISLTLDNAKVVMSHLIGALDKPKLKCLKLSEQDKGHWRKLIDDIGSDTIGSEFLWSPSGRPVEIRVVAGKRAGGSSVSRWLFGMGIDEAPRMVGASEGVINYDDTKRGAKARILPGGQILSIGSPWQPQGPIYDAVQNDWGTPTEHRVVIKAPGPAMNPVWWTPERCQTTKEEDPVVYQTDVLAEFADAEESLFPQSVLTACARKTNDTIPYEEGHDYKAAMDPATRRNAWTIVIGDRKGSKKRVVFHKQWQGTPINPLSPVEVMKEVRHYLNEYQLDWVYTDQFGGDFLRDIGMSLGVNVVVDEWTAKKKVEMFQSLATAASVKGVWEIPNDPMIMKDLRMTKRILTATGVSIRFEKTTDNRHCDYAPPLARLFKEWIDEDFDLPPKRGEDGYWARMEKEMIKEEEKELKEHGKEWWEKDPEEDFEYDILRGVF